MIAFCCDTLPVLSSTLNITHKNPLLLFVVAFTPHALICVFFTQLASCLIYLKCSPTSLQPWNQLG